MNNNSKKNYFLLALVAVAAASIGWGVSALGTNQKTAALTPAPVVAPAVSSLTPVAQPVEMVNDAAAPVAMPAPVAPVAAEAPAPLKRRASARPRPVAPVPSEDIARNESSENSPKTTLPVRDRKKGISNGAKTAIAIGGGAATGAAIGGIAGGGKGAAIGAAIGGGGGAIYSIIRKKQGKEVW
jgi:hypothetical protein